MYFIIAERAYFRRIKHKHISMYRAAAFKLNNAVFSAVHLNAEIVLPAVRRNCGAILKGQLAVAYRHTVYRVVIFARSTACGDVISVIRHNYRTFKLGAHRLCQRRKRIFLQKYI